MPACLLCELINPGLVFHPLLTVPSSRIIHNSQRLDTALRATLPANTEAMSAEELHCSEGDTIRSQGLLGHALLHPAIKMCMQLELA